MDAPAARVEELRFHQADQRRKRCVVLDKIRRAIRDFKCELEWRRMDGSPRLLRLRALQTEIQFLLKITNKLPIPRSHPMGDPAARRITRGP